jgi:hypothetical protein
MSSRDIERCFIAVEEDGISANHAFVGWILAQSWYLPKERRKPTILVHRSGIYRDQRGRVTLTNRYVFFLPTITCQTILANTSIPPHLVKLPYHREAHIIHTGLLM